MPGASVTLKAVGSSQRSWSGGYCCRARSRRSKAANRSGSAQTPATVAAADLNSDGKIDLVTANRYRSDTVSVLLGNGDGTFLPQQTFAAGVPNPTTVLVADVNRDGPAWTWWLGATRGAFVSVLLGNGDGTFQAPALSTLAASFR